MKLWIRIDAAVRSDPNVNQLAEELGIPFAEAVGLCTLVWAAIAEHRPSGDLNGLSISTLEKWADFCPRKGKPAGSFGKLFLRLFTSDGNASGWRDRQGKLIERAEKERARKFRGNGAENLGNSAATERNVTIQTTNTGKSEKPEEGYPADFELLWKTYPRRSPASNKAGTYRLFKQHLKNGVAYDVMFEGTKRYAAACISKGIVGTEFVKDAKTFFGRDKHFLDQHDAEQPRQKIGVGTGIPTPEELARIGIRLA